MKKILAMLLGLTISFSHNSFAADPEYKGLFDCEKKMNELAWFSGSPNYSITVLKKELIVIKDRRTSEIYVLTPDFAAKTSTSDSNFRIPYQPQDIASEKKGYFYWDGQNPRFLPGDPQIKPDFSQMKSATNGVTVTSINGVDQFAKSSVDYKPLDIEDKIWNENLQAEIPPEVNTILITDIQSRTKGIPPEKVTGQHSDCWGHLGCDYLISTEMADSFNKTRQDAIDTCKSAEFDNHLELFKPKGS